jgi:uncharacterized protein
MLSRNQNILNKISQSVRHIEPNAEIILFGSRSRSEENFDSDWDILILSKSERVTRKLERAFKDELYEIELEIGEPISSFVFAKADWESKHKFTPLYNNIVKEGIAIS